MIGEIGGEKKVSAVLTAFAEKEKSEKRIFILKNLIFFRRGRKEVSNGGRY